MVAVIHTPSLMMPQRLISLAESLKALKCIDGPSFVPQCFDSVPTVQDRKKKRCSLQQCIALAAVPTNHLRQITWILVALVPQKSME